MHRWTLHCTAGNHYKFYEIVLDGATVRSRYGKIGTPGKDNPMFHAGTGFGGEARAANEAERLLQQKLGKGYQVVSETNDNGKVIQPKSLSSLAGGKPTYKGPPVYTPPPKKPAPKPVVEDEDPPEWGERKIGFLKD